MKVTSAINDGYMDVGTRDEGYLGNEEDWGLFSIDSEVIGP